MGIDLECVVNDLIEVSAKRALDEMPADKRAAFDAAIAAKVDEFVSKLTADKVGAMLGGNVVAVAVGHLRHLVNQQVETGKGAIIEVIRSSFAEVFTPETVKALVRKTVETKASAMLREVMESAVNGSLNKAVHEAIDVVVRKAR